MLPFVLAFAIVLGVLGAPAEPPGGYYTTRYDHVDVDNILNQKRLVQNYAKCFFNTGPCTAQGHEFKRILPEAIRTNCLRCTEKQRYVVARSMKRLQKEHPQVYKEIVAHWDPENKYLPVLIGEGINNEIPLGNTEPTKVPQESKVSIVPYVPPSQKVPTTRSPPISSTRPPVVLGNRFGDNEASIPTKPSQKPVFINLPTIAPNEQNSVDTKLFDNFSPSNKGTTTTVKATPSKTFSTTKKTSVSSQTTKPKPTTTNGVPLLLPVPILPPLPPPVVPTLKPVSTNFNTPDVLFTPTYRTPALLRPKDVVSASGRFLKDGIETLSSIGNQVVDTGVRIADMFVSSVQGLLGR